MSSTASEQRKALASALRAVAPDAPTLCEGWAAEDLAVHIVIRDSRPDLLVGQGLPVVGAKARNAIASLKAEGYEYLVDRVSIGPPSYFPQTIEPVNDAMNSAEFYIHTEDVLRAQHDFDPHQRRDVSEELRKRLWKQSSMSFFPMAARKQNRRISFFSPGYGATTRGPATAPLVMVHGAPEELTLWAAGRADKAEVDITEA
ncbi:TIGR03085 family metal-binding protein [Nesterenkonia salmonea]|nr:TIGR03085 family metal-binding protein [Nesterenkonia salmonea]